MKPQRGIITCILARHVTEATALGRSLRLNSPGIHSICVVEGILEESAAKKLARVFDKVVPLREEHFKMGWLVKHVAIQYAEAEENLFLDSDCLVLKPLDPAFDAASGKEVSFATKPEPVQEIGSFLYAGISLKKLLNDFSVDWWPQILGGGHFFFRNTDQARHIFERAIYWGRPDVIAPFGWTDPTRAAPDELTLQMALAEAKLHRECALIEFPLVCWTPWNSSRPDTIAKRISSRDRNTGVRSWTNDYFAAHFGGDAGSPTYLREQWRLAIAELPMGRLLARGLKPAVHMASLFKVKYSRLAGRLRTPGR